MSFRTILKTGYGLSYLNDKYERKEWYLSDGNIYVTTTGDDTHGTGTILEPYKTLERACEDVAIRSQKTRAIYLGAGTFDCPKSIDNLFITPYHYIYGTNSVSATYTADTIVHSSDSLGVRIRVTGAGWTPQAHIGKLIKWTSGAYNNTYGIVYDNDADSLWITHDLGYVAVPHPAAKTFQILSLDTTLNISQTGGSGISGSRLFFQYLKMTGTTNITAQQSIVFYSRCYMDTQYFTCSNGNFIDVETCYLAATSGTLSTHLLHQGSTIKWRKGTVIDGKGTLGIFSRNAVYLRSEGEVVFARLSSQGVRCTGTSYGGDGSQYAVFRFYNCAKGFTHGWYNHPTTLVEARNCMRLPRLFGNITGNYMIEATAGDYYQVQSGTSVTTALGTNTCSVNNGSSEGYFDPDKETIIVGVTGSDSIISSKLVQTITGGKTFNAEVIHDHKYKINYTTPAQITSNQNNYVLTDVIVHRLSSDASRTITGIAAETKKYVVFINVGSFPIVLTNEDTASTASNRIIVPYGNYLTINPNELCHLWYDTASTRWRVFAEGRQDQIVCDGAVILKRTATAINYLTNYQDYIIGVTNTAAPRQITIDSASALISGKMFVIKDESGGAAANNITIVGQAGQTFDGAANIILAANYAGVTIYSNGTNWFVRI